MSNITPRHRAMASELLNREYGPSKHPADPGRDFTVCFRTTTFRHQEEELAKVIAAAEAASAAKAVEPWEKLASYVADKGGSLDCLRAAPDGCVFLFCNDKQSTNAPPSEAARDLCVQLGLLPPENER